MVIPSESTRAAKSQREWSLRELDAPRAWKPFLSRHVRGSLHKRACEQNDPFAPDVMLNVCSCLPLRGPVTRSRFPQASYDALCDQFASYTKNTGIRNARRCL